MFFACHKNMFPPELWALDPLPLYLNLVRSLGSMLFLSKTSCDKVSTSKHQLQTQRIIESEKPAVSSKLESQASISATSSLQNATTWILALNFETYLVAVLLVVWCWINNTESTSESYRPHIQNSSIGFICSFMFFPILHWQSSFHMALHLLSTPQLTSRE